ncbi:MAG TPA: carboxypeptidase-like regulatory domain-containing protein [Thermoanaerobaculia bacterium]|nr:carboxypeptidase-like regulatory domain-containing protein [Thermoanaerobaculia bacterium]
MRRRPTAILAFLLPAILSGGRALAAPTASPVLASPVAPPISGIVSHLERPIAGALVILYNLGDTSLSRSRTATDGTFVLASAPVGVYDVVAYKKGFVPALVRLWHQTPSEGISAVRIQLAARNEKAGSADAVSSVWEMREKVPADVLRELSIEAGTEPAAVAENKIHVDRALAGEVRTVTQAQGGDASLSRTAVGVHGGLPNGWRYDLRGDYSAVSDPAGIYDTSATTGNAAGLVLDVGSDDDHVSLTTRKHTLSLHDDRVASLQSHGVSWSRGTEEGNVESVAARYVDETNLYRATSPGANFFPLASRTLEVRANYERAATDTPGVAVAMTYRHREGTVGPSAVGSDGAFLMSAPDGDLSAGTSVKLSSSAEMDGGVVARYLAGGYGIAPVLGARYDLGSKSYLYVRGLYRVVDTGTGTGTVLPLVTSVDERGEAFSARGWTVGFEKRTSTDVAVKAEVSDQVVSEAVRAFFEGDFLTDFDSLYLFEGNTVRQYKLSASRRLSQTISGSVAVRYGSIAGEPSPESALSYGIVDNSGKYWSARAAVDFVPSGTGIAVLVRNVQQVLNTSSSPHSNDSRKFAVSLAQDLSVMGVNPFGSVCKLLLAVERARSASQNGDDAPTTNRLLGGVALSF